MILITKVRILGFRSFLSAELPKLGHLVALVGKNSSGKSNVLRALNLFFNDEVQPGQKLYFPRDLFEQPKHRKKKRVSITVDFDLPTTFVLRNKLENLAILGRQFSITRSWELDNQLNIVSKYAIELSGNPVPNADDLARQFLSLISYRYIPNRTVPTDILRDESQALAASVFLRMKDQTHVAALMGELTEASARMLKDASQSMQNVSSPLQNPTVSTSSLNQMLSMAGFQARGNHGGSVRDAEWGAGHQAFFLYQVLRTLDTDYSRFFGWRQATIWAVEEPESALHRDLETGLASQFRLWTQDT
jgi:predicted ATP-dependent endonuclease of OLD family